MHLVLAAADSRDALQRELSLVVPEGSQELAPGLFACEFAADSGGRIPYLAFARQLLPDAREVHAESINAWASLLADAIVGVLPDEQTWSLHVIPFKSQPGSSRMGARAWHSRARTGQAPPRATNEPQAEQAVGANRCQLIRATTLQLLEKRRRHLARSLRQHDGVYVSDEALVQLLLVAPNHGFLSIAQAPFPFQQQHVVSCFPNGEVPIAVDKQAPSRAFAKLVEAELRLGRRIAAKDRCVDLGASPGSWTYVAVRRGGSVISVDHADLRLDLMQHKNVRFQRGDAFRFEPPTPVDWLLCDVIASAERSADLLLGWLRKGWCQHFVVTLKVDDEGSSAVLARLKQELPNLTSELYLLRLCANKKEVCAFGTLAE